MSEAQREPFERHEHLDEPGIIGARWWQQSLAEQGDAVSRRSALGGILIATGAIMAAGVAFSTCVAAVSSGGGDDYRTESRGALDMQREYGWSFGAAAERLTFDGTSTRAFDRAALGHLADDLRPASARHAPFFVPTLFQSPSALARSIPQGDTPTTTPLSQALTPIFTPAMDRAYRAGRALASLFRGQSPAAAVLVDLPGPEAVAFAAGAAGVLDPVFLFDNWPHPRGVVPAHLTLAAAAYYQPLFARRKAASGAPLFVLDRARLASYVDDAAQFDNRHVARLPSAAQLKSLGVQHVLHVVPSSAIPQEMDDLNDDFVLYAKAGIEVRLLGADAFSQDPGTSAEPAADEDDLVPRAYYGGSARSHLWFWTDYPWIRPPSSKPPPQAPSMSRPGKDYIVRARTTPFSTGSPSTGGTRPRPGGFGTVSVVVAVATGAILGAKLSRSGSWLRSSSWGGG
jgi:hypothetical protein